LKKTFILAVLGIASASAGFAFAREPQWGGLGAIAVSPDGKVVATGGQNRVLYLLDGATLEVRREIWVRARIGTLAFNKDGTRLLLEDDDKNLRVFDPANGSEVKSVGKMEDIAWCASADLVAGLAGSSKNLSVQFLGMTDGAPLGAVACPERPASFALDAEGKTLAVLSEGRQGDEKKADPKEMPKELKGAEKKEWQQRNDGRVSTLRVFEVPSGKELRKADLWFTPDTNKTELLVTADAVFAVGYGNACARIDAKGETTIFEMRNSFNYGRGVSAAHKAILTGGLRNGSRLAADTMAAAEFQLDALPGFPEYWETFVFLPDGSALGATSCFRIARISKEGRLETVVPVVFEGAQK
jgi:hypothetical protein